MRSLFHRATALVLSLTLGAGLALVVSPAAVAAPADDSTLSSLVVSAGQLSPDFDPAQTSYTVSVPHDTTTFSFTPTSTDPEATMTSWNGDVNAPASSGTPVTARLRGTGANILTLTVTGPLSAPVQYTLMVTKLPAPAPLYDLDLAALSISSGELSPAFSASTTSYTVDVPHQTTSMTFTATAVETANTVTVTNAGSLADGATVALTVPGTTVLITVTAPDSTSKVYTVHVARAAAPTADVDLAGIELSVGTLSPEFDPATRQYTATVPYAVRAMQVTATASTPGHTLTINNEPMTDGAPATVPVIIDPMGNGFAITVRADNGAEKTYVVTVTRDEPSNNADLASLSLSNGTLSPEFSSDVLTYTATVPYLTTSTTVTAAVADETAILRVNGQDTDSGATTGPIALPVGTATILVTVTAEDSVTTTSHTIVITREAPDLDLSSLSVSGGVLAPEFDPATTSYTLALAYPIGSVDVAASAEESDWTLEINGEETSTATVPTPVGSSTITVTVTALHGESRDYTITLTRDAPSNDATLAGITLSDGTLSPSFSSAVHDYTASVHYLTDELTVAAAVADATATMAINGQAATSAVLPLAVGENTVTIVTTAQDGTTATTTIVVTREVAPTPEAGFSLDFEPGDDANGAPFSVSGANLLPGSTVTVTMHSTPVVLVTGTVFADGSVALSGQLPAAIEAGAHRLVFEGTAMDTSAVTATAWFTVLRDGTIGAVSLTGPVAWVEPAAVGALPTTGADVLALAAVSGLAAALGLLLLLGAARRRALG